MAVTLRHTEERRSYKRDRGVLCVGTQWVETAHEGCVIRTAHESYQIMSDVWGDRHFAIVWNPATGAPESVTLRIVDYGCGGSGHPVWDAWNCWYHSAVVDATDEVKAAYAAWQEVQEEERTLSRHRANVELAAREAATVKKGSRVEVFKGRKVPKGTTGECFWVGESRWGYRCGINGDDGETHWTALSNVRVVEGHENWSDSCQDCGGSTWLPAHDGKGGTVACPACERRAAERAAEREREEAERRAAIKAEEASGGYIGRGAKVKVVKSEGRDAPVGVAGEVFWRGANKFGPGERVGFKADGNTYWAAVENVCRAA